jgi:hypothetical protein
MTDDTHVLGVVALDQFGTFSENIYGQVRILLDFSATVPSFEDIADQGLIFVVELLSNSGDLSALEVSNFDRTPTLSSARECTEHQLQDRLFTESIGDDLQAPAFLDEQTLEQNDIRVLYDASSMGSLSFETHTCSRSFLELSPQRSPPRLFTAAAWSDLRPAPESRSRGGEEGEKRGNGLAHISGDVRIAQTQVFL